MNVVKEPGKALVDMMVSAYKGFARERIDNILTILEEQPEIIENSTNAFEVFAKLASVINIPFVSELEGYIRGSFRKDTRAGGSMSFQVGSVITAAVTAEGEVRTISGSDAWVRARMEIDGGLHKEAQAILSEMNPVDLKTLLENAREKLTENEEG